MSAVLMPNCRAVFRQSFRAADVLAMIESARSLFNAKYGAALRA